MNVRVDISIGEFFDKLTILEIKRSRIDDPAKLQNVERELSALHQLLEDLPFSVEDVSDEAKELKELNEKLWLIEDKIRAKESQKDFDSEFVDLARAVYQTNDRRFEVKQAINKKLGSDFVEEKSYKPY